MLLNDGDRFAGTKSDWLTIRNFAKADFGKYYVLVTGLCGEKVKSPIFTLVETDIKFSRQPEPQIICEGYPAVISGLAITSSNENIIYQWFKNGSILVDNAIYFGTNTNTLTITNPTKDAQGDYSLQASLETTGIVVNSNLAALTINTAPVITMEPEENISAIVGRPLEIEVSAESNTPGEKLKYQWYQNDKAIANATGPLYSKSAAQTEDEGTYRCEITNTCGTTKSANAAVTVTTTTISDVTDVNMNGYTQIL
jgi:hypothetical protein